MTIHLSNALEKMRKHITISKNPFKNGSNCISLNILFRIVYYKKEIFDLPILWLFPLI